MTPDDFTHSVLARLDDCPDPRLKAVTDSLIRHLHAFIAEVKPTEQEWLTGIQFLTRTGQISDDRRQEFILLSDTLGVSMLVDLINHDQAEGLTDTTVLGPFFVAGQPIRAAGHSLLERPEPGVRLTMRGSVRDLAGRPLAGARIDVWQTTPDGVYDVQDPGIPAGHLRGAFLVADDGGYSFETVMPCSYPIPTDGPVGSFLEAQGRHPYRPAHIHFMISMPGMRRLVTHLFIAGDVYLESDTVFGVKPSLIVEPVPTGPDTAEIVHDFGLQAE